MHVMRGNLRLDLSGKVTPISRSPPVAPFPPQEVFKMLPCIYKHMLKNAEYSAAGRNEEPGPVLSADHQYEVRRSVRRVLCKTAALFGISISSPNDSSGFRQPDLVDLFLLSCMNCVKPSLIVRTRLNRIPSESDLRLGVGLDPDRCSHG